MNVKEKKMMIDVERLTNMPSVERSVTFAFKQ